MWKSPRIVEVAVGLEINCYACAEIQRVADRIVGKGQGGTLIRKEIINLNPGITIKEITLAHENEARESLKRKGILIMDDDSFTMKAYGGKIKKKKMAYGGKTMKKYAKGGGVRKAQTYG